MIQKLLGILGKSGNSYFMTGLSNGLSILRSNFIGTEFNIWNNGQNPSKAKTPDNIREQLGAVLYVSESIYFGS